MTTMIVDDLGRIPMSPYLTATLTRAADYATAQSHREVTLEHLLLALAEDPEATIVLKSSSIDLGRLTAEVSDYLGHSDDRIEAGSGQTIAISGDLRRILEAAAAAARQGRRREINGAIVLAAIVGDGKSTAAHLLRVQGLTFEEAIRALQRAASPPEPPQQALPPQPAHHHSEPEHEPDHEPQPPPNLGPPPQPDLTRPAPPVTEAARDIPAPHTEPDRLPTTEEILASARERLQNRHGETDATHAPSTPSPLPRANYPDLGGPPRPTPTPREPERPAAAGWSSPAPAPSTDRPPFAAERPEPPAVDAEPVPAPWPEVSDWHEPEPTPPPPPSDIAASGRWSAPPRSASRPPAPPPPAAPQQQDRKRAGASGPFVGSWPLIEAGQLVENIPRRMRIGIPVVAEARIARADVKALAEGLQGGGAAFRHEVVVTKAMSVRLRAPDGGFSIENRSPETQWIENVLGLGSDDYASWRWTVTPRARGKRQLQLIVSARTIGADGMTAETALPDQTVDVKVAINYARTAARWFGWIAAAVVGGLLAKFGETGWMIAQVLFAQYLGG
ncbi:Clp protease N-terminal domain-containing protein [Hyphomicrobium sp. CS1GBMeth3]|uniref:Clp protease N-terminal domain-containing protein n=1 Tax=Hyphomicrobium sp. CS1GBMeth3 TaxID=1892845 RepID=UPI000A5B2F66|nr:Clp protease N-terminal domain-containing protein [Hyphomicrobium sp. CS1GBMeth3]